MWHFESPSITNGHSYYLGTLGTLNFNKVKISNTMIFSQTTLLPMLLLIGNTIATIKFSYAGSHLGTHLNPAAGHLPQNLYRRNYTEQEVEKKFLDNLKDPTECMKKCDHPDENPYVPLCSVQPARNSQDTVLTENTFNCICTDKKYLAQGMSCLIRQVRNMKKFTTSGLSISSASFYNFCLNYTDTCGYGGSVVETLLRWILLWAHNTPCACFTPTSSIPNQ